MHSSGADNMKEKFSATPLQQESTVVLRRSTEQSEEDEQLTISLDLTIPEVATVHIAKCHMKSNKSIFYIPADVRKRTQRNNNFVSSI